MTKYGNVCARQWAYCLLLGLGAAGCMGTGERVVPIADIYHEAAQVHTRNPVIVIHGMLGARLSQRSTGKTIWGVRLKGNAGSWRPDFSGSGMQSPGDGSVARYSALGDERQGHDFQQGLDLPIPWKGVILLNDSHLGLTHNPHFVDNALFILLDL